MKIKHLMSAVAFAATIALVFPAQALATATSTITINDQNAVTVPTNIYGGNKYDLTTGGTVEANGEASHSVTSLWSSQSLELDSTNTVVKPEGWNVEYTADGGTSWSSVAPTRTTINGVRTSGDVNRVGSDKYKSTAHPVAVSSSSSFSSNGGGDGFDVIFAGNRIFNIYHHNTGAVVLPCHIKTTGANCYTGATPSFSGYSTNNASAGFYDGNSDSIFAYAMRDSDRHVGFLKIDVSNTNAIAGTTPVFIDLNGAAVGTSTSSYQFEMNNAHRSGDYIWSIDNNADQLLCMQISTSAACPDVVSGQNTYAVNKAPIGTVGTNPGVTQGAGRVTALGAKVIYTTATKIGCFDATTGLACVGGAGTNASHELPLAGAPRSNFSAVPVWNTSGVLLGYCHYEAQTCITDAGLSVAMPTGFATWAAAHPLPVWNTQENAGEWAVQGRKLYFPVRMVGNNDNTTNVACWDSATDALCSGFSGVGVGNQIYAVAPDPQNANCVWTNGNTGQITSFNATTGIAGCSSSTSLVEMTYQTLAPRFGCVESKRVYTWVSAQFTGTTAVQIGDLKITMLDSNSTAIAGWIDRTVDGTGLLALTGLTTAQTGMRPTMQITSADSNDTPSQLEEIFGAITFTAETPQLCFVLKAVTKCVGVTLAGNDHSVPDGIVEVTTSTTPLGLSAVTSRAQSVTPGTTTTGLCAASTPNYTPPSSGGGSYVAPVVTPPKTKRPPVTITIGGFKDGSPVLTRTIQAKIKAFMKKYSDYSVIETKGFTEGPVILKTDYALSKARAVNATKYIKSNLKQKFSVVKIKSGQDKIEASKIRRIVITLSDE
jgi:hypothetical protein